MAPIPQQPHKDICMDSWARTYRSRILTFHPLRFGDTAGDVYSITDDLPYATLLSSTQGSSVYTAGTFSIPADAVPTWDETTRTAVPPPYPFTIACKAGQTNNLVFNQYFVLIDEALVSPKVIYVSAVFAQSQRIAPGGFYTGAAIVGGK